MASLWKYNVFVIDNDFNKVILYYDILLYNL